MKHVSIFLFVIISAIGCDLNYDYTGTWECKGDLFENILVLEKIKDNNYKFSFKGWRKSYDYFSRDTVTFLGNMSDKVFKVSIKEDFAWNINNLFETFNIYRIYMEFIHQLRK